MRSHVTPEALTEGPQVICAGLGLNFARIICRNLLMSPVFLFPRSIIRPHTLDAKFPEHLSFNPVSSKNQSL